MKMYLVQAVNAYAALLALMNQDMVFQTAHSVALAKKEIAPHAEFFAQEERKLVERYAAKEDGKIKWTSGTSFQFADEQAAEEYKHARAELCAVSVELNLEKRTVNAPEIIRPIQIEALADILEFRERGTP